MVWIKELYISGFKNFKKVFKIKFSKEKNLLVGVNGIGKTTILQAIDLVMRKKGVVTFGNGNLGYANYVNRDLIDQTKDKFSKEGIEGFGYEELPQITIAVILESSNEKDERLTSFCGANFPQGLKWNSNQDKLGLYFEYKFDKDFQDEFENYLKTTTSEEFDIPFEFYGANWRTFGGRPYTPNKDPMNTILIDNDAFEGNPFNSFSKRLYSSMNLIPRINSRIEFRKYSKKVKVGNKDEKYRLLINPYSVNLEDIIDVLDQENKIFIRDMGSGTENLIKTKLSLKSNAKLVLIEEPENHLTAENSRKQIEFIKSNFNDPKHERKQIILTTHNPEIITRLELQNTIWLRSCGNEINAQKMDQLNESTISFFNRRDDLDFLRILSAKRVIIVEGSTEFVLMRTLLQRCGYSNDKVNSVEIISMVGREYDSFLDLGSLSGNKILIFTDNDFLADDSNDKYSNSFNERINNINSKNKETKNVKIFCSQAKNGQWKKEWTIEAAIYNKNKKEIEHNPNFRKGKIGSKYYKQLKYNNSSEKLAYMVNNKKKVIFLESQFRKGKLRVPGYIRKGLKWLFTDDN